jgi:periplasmic protein TonB
MQHWLEQFTPQQRAMASTIALYAVLAALVLRTVPEPDYFPPQPFIEVSLVTLPPAAKPAEKPQPAAVVKKITPVKRETVASAMRQRQAKPIAEKPKPQPVAVAESASATQPAMQEIASLSPAHGHAEAIPSNAVGNSTAPVTSPVFDAEYLRNPAPEYPTSAKRRRMQGTVMLSVRVSEAGSALAVRVSSSSGYEVLDQAALQAVKKWKFIPARRGDAPVEASVKVPVEFRLAG